MSFLLRFLTHVSRRLNLRALWRGVCWGALVFGALGALVAIVAVLRGYAAPLLGYGIAAGIGGLCAIILITRWWTSARGVAPYVDQFYGLQDGAVSALHLEQQLTATKGDAPSSTTEAHTLQQRWLEQRLASCDPREVALRAPRRLVTVAAVLVLAAVGLAFVPASPRVLEAQAQAAEVLQRSTEAVEKVQENFQEMEKDLSDAESREMQMSELRQMVERLRAESDPKGVARQFAKLEQKAREKSADLESRQDDAALKRAIAELARSSSPQARDLANALKNMDSKQAREKLQALMPQPLKKDTKPLTKEEIAALKKQLAQLREATMRMASAASQGSAAQGGELSQQMLELDAHSKRLEELLKQLELAQQRSGKCDSQAFNGELARCNSLCESMADRWRRLLARQNARKRLKTMRENLTKAQCYSLGQCQSLTLQQCKGGKKPGTGVQDNGRAPGQELPKADNLTQLKGQQGTGPSLSTVEEAQSGVGISTRRATATARDFSRQLESFIERDTVPEELKSGVKEYFERIHEVQERSQ